MTIEESLRDFLDELGHTADEVADNLRSSGIQGEPKSADTCPIACLISAVNGLRDISVDASVISGWTDENWVIDVEVPEPVAEFIRRFDSGDYRDLALLGDAS